MSTTTTAPAAVHDNHQFWQRIAELPEAAQRSFWDAGAALSRYIGENPNPITLAYDTSKPPANAAWWERMLFYAGQAQYNQSISQVHAGRAVVNGSKWLWGALQGDFNKNPTTGQVITGGVISVIPFVDQVCDVRDIVANCLNLSDPKEREKTEAWIALGLTCIGLIPVAGSAIKTVGKVALKHADKLIDLLKQMEWLEKNRQALKLKVPWGRAPIDWLRKFDWQAACRQAADKAKEMFLNAKQKAESAAKYAIGVVQFKLKQLVELFDLLAKRIGETMSRLAGQIKEKVNRLLERSKTDAGRYEASPGAPNRHGQGDKDVPPNDRPKPKLSGMQTAPNSAFFWSGRTNGVGGDKVAADIAGKRGGTTLEMLIEERGIKMPPWDQSNPASIKAWEDISSEYANGVSGEVRAVIGNSLRPGNIWQTKELPRLLKNPNVTKITVIDPQTLAEKVIFTR
jgi:hypothetical protein